MSTQYPGVPDGSSTDSVTAEPTVRWQRGVADTDSTVPLVVLLHGRGSDESDIIGLADQLPPGPSYAAVRGPIAEGGGYAWFANRGVGRPVPASLAASINWFGSWLDRVAGPGRPVLLVGFSGGATFAGGLALARPERFAGLASLYATLPFDAGVPTTEGRLQDLPVLLIQGAADRVIPVELQARTWDYLHQASGSSLVARRTLNSHVLTQSDLTELAAWITDHAIRPVGSTDVVSPSSD